MTLQEKYKSVVAAAEAAAISKLTITEQEGILYIAGTSTKNEAKDAIWNALGELDPSYSASDININVQVAGLAVGTALTVATEKSNLNIRKEPSTEGAIVGKAAKGEFVVLIDQTSDEWWKVKNSKGEEGYAYSRYLKA